MNGSKTRSRRRLLAAACTAAFVLGSATAAAVSLQAETRPRINLFPTSVVDDLSATSRAAMEMENAMYRIVERLETQKEAYLSTGCDGSDDPGCLQLRKGIRGSYNELLETMQAGIPRMRGSLQDTAESMGTSLRSEIGRKMTPADVQRLLAGRAPAAEGLQPSLGSGQRQGKLSRMFSRYYELVRRGGSQSDGLPVLASQIYLDSMQSLYFLDLIEAEIGSQSTELVLELEWGELTDQITATVTDVKALLWGETDGNQVILEVGLETEQPQESFNDLLVQ